MTTYVQAVRLRLVPAGFSVPAIIAVFILSVPAVQSVTAERIHADYIITRNVRDFAKSKVMAFTPSELLVRI